MVVSRDLVHPCNWIWRRERWHLHLGRLLLTLEGNSNKRKAI